MYASASKHRKYETAFDGLRDSPSRALVRRKLAGRTSAHEFHARLLKGARYLPTA
jgi:hypothetical protein